MGVLAGGLGVGAGGAVGGGGAPKPIAAGMNGDVAPGPATGAAMGSVLIEAKPGAGLPNLVCDGDQTLHDVEREVIIATLQHNSGHRQKTAKALGIGVRTLGLKLKKWKEQKIVESTL